MIWYLFEADDGWCIIEKRNILQAGPIKVQDKCTFFYQGKEYQGTVLMFSEFHDSLTEEMTRLKKAAKDSKRPESVAEPLPLKRRINPVQFYGATNAASNNTGNNSRQKKRADKQPPMSEEEKTRKRISELNKLEAGKRANNLNLILLNSNKSKSTERDNDRDWTPDMDEESQSSVIEDPTAYKTGLKEDRNTLLKSAKNGAPTSAPSSAPSTGSAPSSAPSTGSASSSATTYRSASSSVTTSGSAFSSVNNSRSPSKEELKRQNEALRLKLQGLAHDTNTSISTNQERHSTPVSINNHLSDDIFGDYSNVSDHDIIQDDEQDQDQGRKKRNDDEQGRKKRSDDEQGRKRRSDVEQGEQQGRKKRSERDRDDRTGNEEEEEEGEEAMDVDGDEFLAYQLYGERSGTTEICRNFFCKTEVLTNALANSNCVNHLVRRLMHGVFIPSKILDCTVTGQSWHAGGADRAKEKKKPLHQGALKAIVDFANGCAKKKG